MSEAPKRVWVESKEEWSPSMMSKKQMYAGQAYIRADLVDGLVEALEIMIEAYKGEFGSHWGKQSAEETEGHDEVIQARAALAALKEET